MAANRYDDALAEVEPVLKESVIEHPFIQGILAGDLTKPVYAAYLRETYHLIRQTPYYLSAAATASTEEEWLRDWFLDLAVDERGHDKLCVHDVKKLGFPPETYMGELPGPGAWAMIAQNHYVATTLDPAGILGFAAATEGLGASLGPPVAEAMQQYPFSKGALSFLKVHASEDQEHIARVQEAFGRCAADSDERYTLMLTTWTYTLRAYSQLFTDALERSGDA
jgi:pyrroloquinoline quinone (PQQ) biosynthesis protein C